MEVVIWLILTIIINIPILIWNFLVVVYALGLVLMMVVVHIHGFIVALLMIPIRNIPTVLYGSTNLDTAKRFVIMWRFFIAPVLGIMWFLGFKFILETFLSEVWAIGLAIASAILAVVSYFRLYYEFPLPHPNTFLFLEAESLMRLESKLDRIERQVRFSRWQHERPASITKMFLFSLFLIILLAVIMLIRAG